MFEALLSNRTVGVLVEALPRILTDNGSEFSNPKCIENGPDRKSVV